jgi:hypothetical protein
VPGHRSTAEQLSLVHLRPSRDALLARLGVQLITGATALALVGTESPASRRGDVIGRGPAALLGLAATGTLLVDGAGGDLFRLVIAAPTVLETVLDVLVLALALLAPGLLRHD